MVLPDPSKIILILHKLTVLLIQEGVNLCS
jgi:hypothetical protein